MDLLNGANVQGGSFSGVPIPANQGFKAWSMDPAACGGASTVASSGVLYLSALYVPEACAITGLWWYVSVAAATVTSGQNFAGLYDSGGNLLSSTGIDTDIASTGIKTTAMSLNLTAGLYWGAWLINATTGPQMPRAGGATGTSTFLNWGSTAATYRAASNGTGRTTMPSTFTPSANSTNTGFLCAIK